MAFYVVFGGADGATVLFELPSVRLPEWAAGFRLGGAVSAEGALAAAYDGLRLGTLLVCVGAANALASPRRLLRSVPAALYEVSVAVVVALSVAPQLVSSVARIRRARALRGDAGRGPANLMRTVVVPVLHDRAYRHGREHGDPRTRRMDGQPVGDPRRAQQGENTQQQAAQAHEGHGEQHGHDATAPRRARRTWVARSASRPPAG